MPVNQSMSAPQKIRLLVRHDRYAPSCRYVKRSLACCDQWHRSSFRFQKALRDRDERSTQTSFYAVEYRSAALYDAWPTPGLRLQKCRTYPPDFSAAPAPYLQFPVDVGQWLLA